MKTPLSPRAFWDELKYAPEEWNKSHPVVITTPPIWLRVSAAARLSSLSRSEIEDLIERRLVAVVWRRDKDGKLQPLIFGKSLWDYLVTQMEQPQAAVQEAPAK